MKMFPIDLVHSQFPAWARPAALALALAVTAVAPAAAQETLKAATDCAYFPFSFRDTDSALKGYEIDLGEDMARRANFKIEWVCQKFDGLIPSLLSNKFDIILSTMSITDERRKSIDFSVSYRVSVGQFVVP